MDKEDIVYIDITEHNLTFKNSVICDTINDPAGQYARRNQADTEKHMKSLIYGH